MRTKKIMCFGVIGMVDFWDWKRYNGRNERWGRVERLVFRDVNLLSVSNLAECFKFRKGSGIVVETRDWDQRKVGMRWAGLL